MDFGFLKNWGLGGSSGIDPDLLIHYTFSAINRETDSTAYYDNKGNEGDTYDADLYCGTGLVLGATNDLPIPVGYDLGTDLAEVTGYGNVYEGTGGNTMSNTDNVFSIHYLTSTSFNRPQCALRHANATGDYVFKVVFEVEITSGTATIANIAGTTDGSTSDATEINETVGVGTYTYEAVTHPVTGDLGSISLRFDTTTNQVFDATVTGYSYEVTTTGYLTYETDDGVVQLEGGIDLPNSTTYTLVDDTYRWAYVNENPFSEADLTAIAEEPNKIVEFALDNANSDLTNTQGINDGFYGFRDTDATNPERCYDALSSDYADIASYGASIRSDVANSQTSIQWTCAELDGAGVPTAYNSVANTAIMHSDTQILTGYTPSTTPYSLEETITGDLTDLNASGVSLGTTSQRTEVRLLTTDGTTHKLYINGLLQGYTPSVPSAATEIDLNDTCVIGYADTIDRRDADFKIYDTVRTAEEALEDYNKWVLKYQDVLTDGNGDPITTGDGQYTYI